MKTVTKSYALMIAANAAFAQEHARRSHWDVEHYMAEGLIEDAARAQRLAQRHAYRAHELLTELLHSQIITEN